MPIPFDEWGEDVTPRDHADIIAAVIGGLVWVPLGIRFPRLRFTGIAFVLLPLGIVSVWHGDRFSALLAVAGSIVAIAVDVVINSRSRSGK